LQKEKVLVLDIGDYPRDFTIEIGNLLPSTKDFEILVHGNLTSRSHSGMVMQILPSAAEEIKICQEGVLNYLIPAEFLARRGKDFCSHVVLIKSCPYGLGTSLKCLCNVHTKLITY
jgi:hypothetical protein